MFDPIEIKEVRDRSDRCFVYNSQDNSFQTRKLIRQFLVLFKSEVFSSFARNRCSHRARSVGPGRARLPGTFRALDPAAVELHRSLAEALRGAGGRRGPRAAAASVE